MGIVRKQSIASSIYIYIGFIIGAFNLLFLFKNYFTPEQFGLTRLLIDVSTLLAMLCTFGSCPATIKFFPFYKAYLPAQKNDLPFITIVACLIGCILFICITPLFRDGIIRKFGKNSGLFVEYFYLIYPLTISYAFWYLLESIEWSLQNTVLTNFLKEIGFRIITTLLILIYILKLINFNQFVILFSCLYIIPVLILIFHLYKLNYFNFNVKISKVTKRLKKHILTFSLFIFSGQVLGLVARTSDTIIISSQSSNGLADTAVFTIATFLIALMEVPMRGMMGIAASIISYAWKDKDMLKIAEMYQKTALNLTIIGLAIGCVIYLNAHNLLNYFGPVYKTLPTIILILGISKLVDLGTGLNSQILLSSKYWKIDFGTNMFFVFLSIPLNYYLINKFGIIGSAYANFIATFVYNMIRLLFIWKLFHLQPYSLKNLQTLCIAALAFLVSNSIPVFSNFIVDAFIRSFAFISMYSIAILVFKTSVDLNDMIFSTLRKYGVWKLPKQQ